MNPTKNTKGVSLIEIILVVVILGISIGLSVLYTQTSQVRADLSAQVSQFTSHVRLQHSNALAGLNNLPHGIRMEESSYTAFIGASYNPTDPNNFTVELPPTVTIQNITLNGGGVEIIFSGPDGETTQYGTLDFVSGQLNKTVSITVTELGTVTY